MLSCLNNDNKIQMRLNIKRHRQKLLQYLENINDTVLKPKIKLVSNDIEKSNLNHNVKSKIASGAKLLSPKLEPTIKVTDHKSTSTDRKRKFEPVINTTSKNLKVLTDIDVKNYKTISSGTANQLQPGSILQPISNIEIKDPEPVIKKLKEQLIEELFDSSSSEEIDDNVSVGNDEDWNDIFQTHDESDIDEDDSKNSSRIEAVKHDGHRRVAKNKSKEYLYYSADSDDSELNYPTTRKSKKKNISKKPQSKNNQTKQRFRKPQERSIHNAKERACRERIAERFVILRKSCSYLNTNRRVPSKHSILLAAKKECDLLKNFEKRMLAEKKVWEKANEILKIKIAKLSREVQKNKILADSN